jgi:hypothetical protein
MTTVRSGVLASLISVGAGLTLFAVVPSTDTWLIKEWRIHNPTGAPVVVTLFTVHVVTGARAFLFNGSVPAGGDASGACWLAVGPSGQIQTTPGAIGIELYLSGADLPGHI